MSNDFLRNILGKQKRGGMLTIYIFACSNFLHIDISFIKIRDENDSYIPYACSIATFPFARKLFHIGGFREITMQVMDAFSDSVSNLIVQIMLSDILYRL